jgi:hypothetical protein
MGQARLVARPLPAVQVGKKALSVGPLQRFWPKAKREIGKIFLFLKSFYNLQNCLNSNQI